MTPHTATGRGVDLPGVRTEQLAEAHIHGILSLMNLEGWYYYDTHELRRYLSLDEHCLTLVQDNRVVGSIFSTNYGNQAWLGNIIVAAPSRGQGLAAILIRNAIDQLHSEKQVPVFRLGSVPLAIGLYRKLGFHAESFTTAQEATLPLDAGPQPITLPGDARVRPLLQDDLPDVARLDEQFFKSNRLALLTELYNSSIKDCCLALTGKGQLTGFIMIRRRQASRAEGGFTEGPEDVYRLGPCCVLPAVGIDGFKALFQQAIRAVNDEVRRRETSATIYVVFPRNADREDIYRDTRDLAGAMDMAPDLDLDGVFDEHAHIFGAPRSAKNDAQWEYMASLGFHQEYFEQVMSHTPGEAMDVGPAQRQAIATQSDPEGIFATATPGDKA